MDLAGPQVLTHAPWFLLVDRHPSEPARAVMTGAGRVVNVVLAERIIRRRATRPAAVTADANG